MVNDEELIELITQYKMLESEYTIIFNHISDKVKHLDNPALRFIEVAEKYKHPELLITMLNRGDYTELLWEIINP